ncbi:hypothetical protein [Synechococcus sp. MIT S1220]|uniref:hypothetical protein n=1 Tax=Synechococcus sp. MIT S1220 TaxID=3082549 RepID=UPI0039B0E293
MTNLSGANKAVWFSRERVLVGLPLLAGGLMAAIMYLLLVRPAWVGVDGLRERLEQLEVVQQSLPSLERKLAKAQEKQQDAEDQQALLVDLIAGRERIQTFLAWLDRDAQAAGVELKFYEPTKPQSAPPQQSNRPQLRQRTSKKDASDETAPTDPLLGLGYRKTSLLLRVQGAFADLQDFLQRMERLQLLVESSDLELEQVDLPAAPSEDPNAEGLSGTMLGLRLTFYDKQPVPPDVEAVGADPKAESASLKEAPN